MIEFIIAMNIAIAIIMVMYLKVIKQRDRIVELERHVMDLQERIIGRDLKIAMMGQDKTINKISESL